jgi:hypothetical protein
MKRAARWSDWADRWRSYTMHVDGKRVGSLRRGRELVVDATPGAHHVVASIDWCSSNTLHCVVPGSGSIEVEVASNLRGRRLLLAPWYLFVQRRGWVRIRLAGTKS